MISNNELLKLFVRVPSNVEFNGTAVSGAANEKRLFFEEATGKIWAKGTAYGGGLSTEQVQAIVNQTIGLGDDGNATIDRLNEVLAWFENLPEGDAGALALVGLVGHPSSPAVAEVLYTAEDDEVIAGTKQIGDVKVAAQEAVEASGLYALVEQNTADIVQNASDIDALKTEIGEKAVKYTQAEADEANAGLTGAVAKGASVPADYLEKIGSAAAGETLTAEEAAAYNATLTGAKTTESIKTPSTGIYKYVDDELLANEQVTAASLNDLNTRVSTLEEFDPWEDYVAPAQPGE